MRNAICTSLLAGCLVACGTNTMPPPPEPDLSMSSPLPDLAMPMQPDDLTMMASDDSGGPTPDMIQCDPVTKLFPPKVPGTFYCPFGKTDAGSLYCTGGVTHCCEPLMGNAPATCVAEATPCDNGDTDWACEDPTDCPAQMVCCASGTLVQPGNPKCGNYATGFHATHCSAFCMPNEIQMCTSNNDCGNGKMCVPFGAKGNQVGGCG